MNTQFSFLSFYARHRKILFWLLFISFLLSIGWAFFFYSNPFALSPSLSAVPQYETETIPVGRIGTLYRSLPDNYPAFYAFVTYVSSFITPQKVALLFGAIGLILLWSWLLSLASRFHSTIAYPIYFLFATFIYQIQPSTLFLSQQALWLDILLFLLLILPSFLARLQFVFWEVENLLLIYLPLFIGLASGYAFKEQWIGLHSFVTLPLLPILFLTLLFALFVTPALPISFLFLSRSKSIPLKLGGYLLLLLYGFFSIYDLVVDLDLLSAQFLPFFPILFFSLSSLLAPFIYQELFYQNRHLFHSHFSFVSFFFSIGTALLLLLGVYWSTGEFLLTRLLDRITLEIHAFMFLAILLYIFVNFRFRVPADASSFFNPSSFAFYHLFLLCMVFLTFIEGREKWRTLRIALCNYVNAQADHFLLKQDYKQAYLQYQFALHWARNDIKANYNSAIALLQLEKGSPRSAIDFFKRSLFLRPWLHATLNLAHLYKHRGNPKEAEKIILDFPNWQYYPELVSALAYFAYEDSAYEKAVSILKRAKNPNAIIFSNLFALYIKNNRLKPAKEAILIASKISSDNPYVGINRIFLSFKDSSFRDTSHLDIWKPKDSLNFVLTYQTSLLAYSQHRYAEVLKRLSNYRIQFHPYATPLYLFSVGQLEGLEKAHSIYQFHANQSSISKMLHLTMARLYFSFDMPESAKNFFFKGKDSLRAWLITIDAGFHEKGIRGLLAFITQHPEFYKTIRKDEAMLYRVHEDYESAALIWNFRNMTQEEYFRLARYAYQANKPQLLFDVLSEYIEKIDSTHFYPYYLAALYDLTIQEFRRAKESLQLGFQKAHKKEPLFNLLGYFYLLTDQKDSLKTLLSNWKGSASWAFLLTHYLNHFRDTSSDSLLIYAQRGRYEEAWCRAAGLALIKTQKSTLLQKLFYQLTELNPNNPWYWFYLAQAYQQLNMEDDYLYCKEQFQNVLPDFHPLRYLKQEF